MSINSLDQSKQPIKNDKKSLYTFHSAKKIYFSYTPSKIFLIEKKEKNDCAQSLSLLSRNTMIISKENGILVFPRSR